MRQHLIFLTPDFVKITESAEHHKTLILLPDDDQASTISIRRLEFPISTDCSRMSASV